MSTNFSDYIKLSDTREKKGKRREYRYKYITAPGIAQYPFHTPCHPRALAYSRKGPELQRAARERAIQRVRVSRAAWRPVAELHGIFERACIGSRRGWMASGGDGGGVHDEKRMPQQLQPAVHNEAEKATSARGDAGCMCYKHRWRWVCRGGMGPSARVEQRQRDWSEDAHGARGPDGGAGAEHQGALTQALRMQLVLRVVRSGCTASSMWVRDGVKDATLQSGNRVGAMVENDVFLLLQAGRCARGREGRLDSSSTSAVGNGTDNSRCRKRTGHTRIWRRISMWRVNGSRIEEKARRVLSTERREVKMYSARDVRGANTSG
ncbi:hypothetical protein B0H13DRAFT_1864317 [Mycena leptocephala]|nr:hypothetical protein B0H13DRAFT_1864317 [Mycena leptocephala]